MVAGTSSVQCPESRRDGTPCRGKPLPDGRCWAHSPTTLAARQAARTKGGQGKSAAARLGKLVPPRLLPIFDKLEAALNEVHDGVLDPRKASAMAALAGALVKVLQSGEFEQRIRALEDQHGGKTP